MTKKRNYSYECRWSITQSFSNINTITTNTIQDLMTLKLLQQNNQYKQWITLLSIDKEVPIISKATNEDIGIINNKIIK